MVTQVYNRIPKNPKQAVKVRSSLDDSLNADLFKALGDATRLKLLACLAKCSRACSVSELAECCDIDLSVVSRHLAVLARAGIIEGAKAGRTVFYKVRYKEISEVFTMLSKALKDCCMKSESEACCNGQC